MKLFTKGADRGSVNVNQTQRKNARHGHDYVCASSYAEAVAALSARGIIKPLRVQ
jgi:hypothetical protein